MRFKPRFRRKWDANHHEVAQILVDLHCGVVSLAALGGGIPDILASRNKKTILIEVKTKTGKVQDNQSEFAAGWPGICVVCRSVDDVILIAQKYL